MTQVIVNDSLIGVLGAASGEAELFDSSSQRLGYFLSEQAYRQLVCRWARSQVTDDELERCRQESDEFSTAEVLERLQNS